MILPEYVLRAIRQHHGLDEHDSSHDDRFQKMNFRSVLDDYLRWHGILGYTADIVTIAKLFGAKE